mmetsp:Transcript_5583/g.14203  ORF Transcript_5583/g.14203 Transcript_5583/m.14203 type:complete len:205 (+) Transcript_5583:186-800(+)
MLTVVSYSPSGCGSAPPGTDPLVHSRADRGRAMPAGSCPLSLAGCASPGRAEAGVPLRRAPRGAAAHFPKLCHGRRQLCRGGRGGRHVRAGEGGSIRGPNRRRRRRALRLPYGELDVLELRVADCWAKDAARLNANRYRAALRHQVLADVALVDVGQLLAQARAIHLLHLLVHLLEAGHDGFGERLADGARAGHGRERPCARIS